MIYEAIAYEMRGCLRNCSKGYTIDFIALEQHNLIIQIKMNAYIAIEQ